LPMIFAPVDINRSFPMTGILLEPGLPPMVTLLPMIQSVPPPLFYVTQRLSVHSQKNCPYQFMLGYKQHNYELSKSKYCKQWVTLGRSLQTKNANSI
jgi:hypothetical protein